MPDQTRLLVVDDDADIRELLSAYLARYDMAVETAADGAGLFEKLDHAHFDLIILDIMLPGEDGLSLCRRLRGASSIPVIFLTALDSSTDRVVGLELGADDYVVKPFDPRELLARIRTVLRRASDKGQAAAQSDIRRFAGWTLNVRSRELSQGDERIALSDAMYRLLLVFLIEPRVSVAANAGARRRRIRSQRRHTGEPPARGAQGHGHVQNHQDRTRRRVHAFRRRGARRVNLDRLLPKTSFGRFFLINVISLALFWLLIQPMANYWRNQALFRMVASNESRLFLTHIRLLDKLPTIAERNGLFNPNDDVFSIRVSHLPPDMPQDGSNYSRSLRRRLERAFKQENIRYTDLLTRIVVSHAPITVMNSEEKYSDLETFLTHHYMQAEIALRRPDGIWIYAKHQIEIMPQNRLWLNTVALAIEFLLVMGGVALALNWLLRPLRKLVAATDRFGRIPGPWKYARPRPRSTGCFRVFSDHSRNGNAS